MTTEQPTQVPESLHVNEATLELLERRIESRIKVNFFGWIGAPVGLAGIMAIAFTLFSYIPNHISSYLEKDPTFKSSLQKAADDYLKDTERGQKFVKEQIERTARDQIQAVAAERVRAEVTSYFADAEGGRKLVAGQVTAAVGNYFKTTGQAAIQQQVAGYLASSEVQQTIRDQVKRELEPRIAGLLEPVMKNTAKQVTVVAELEDVVGIEKGTIDQLRVELQSPKGRELRAGSQPVALTKRIQRGRVYEAGAIHYYLDTLAQEFRGRFRHVVIAGADGAFLGRIDPPLFQARLRDAEGPLMRVLNAGPTELTPDQARAELNRIFNADVVAAIPPGMSAKDALRAKLWSRGAAAEVPVLKEGGRFIGTTTRDQLLAAVLRPIPG